MQTFARQLCTDGIQMRQHPIEVLLADVRNCVANALAEDIGTGDISAALVPASRQASARVICRDDAVICGRPWVDEVLLQVDPTLRITWRVADGQEVAAGSELFVIDGCARSILTVERTALNFLQLLSGTATATRAALALVAGTTTRLLDTRKTVPGLRTAQKYAVRCGGGRNHRLGLFDAFLIKENHIAAAGGISAAVRAARVFDAGLMVEVEVETLEQLEEAIRGGADLVMLDNFELPRMREAVALCAGRTLLEASGGISVQELSAIAATGVDFVSVGALTKHVRAVDLSLRFAAVVD